MNLAVQIRIAKLGRDFGNLQDSLDLACIPEDAQRLGAHEGFVTHNFCNIKEAESALHRREYALDNCCTHASRQYYPRSLFNKCLTARFDVARVPLPLDL